MKMKDCELFVYFSSVLRMTDADRFKQSWSVRKKTIYKKMKLITIIVEHICLVLMQTNEKVLFVRNNDEYK